MRFIISVTLVFLLVVSATLLTAAQSDDIPLSSEPRGKMHFAEPRRIPIRPPHVQPTTPEHEPLPVGPVPAPVPRAEDPSADGADGLFRGTSEIPKAAPGEVVVVGCNAPLGTPDRYVVATDQALSVAAPGFLANDIDLDGEALSATAIVDNVDHGALAAFADGSFTYTPDPGFTGTDEIGRASCRERVYCEV